jgi:hypothetical protein
MSSDRWPSLDKAALSGLAGEIVSAIEPHTEADPVALLVHLLAEYSCLIGRWPHVVLDGNCSPVLFWPVCVGETSKARKGSASKRVQGLFQWAVPNWSRGENRGTLSSGEGLVYAIRDDQLDHEGETREGVSDKRLFLVQSEFGSVLKVMGRDGNTLSGVVRDAWDGENLSPMTKGDPIRASWPCVGIVGHITKQELLQYLRDLEASNGFGNRFAYFLVRRSKCLPFANPPDEEKLRPLIMSLSDAARFGCSSKEIGLSPEAKDMWAEVYPQLSDGKPGLAGALTARSEAYVRRIAALYAMLARQNIAGVTHLQAALALWKYSEESVQLIFGNVTGNWIADKILEAIRESPQGLADTDISGLFHRNVEQGKLEQAKRFLEKGALIQCIVQKTPGRDRRIWTAAA